MGRRVWLGGEEWDAAQSQPSVREPVTARAWTSVTFTRLSDGLEIDQAIETSSFDAATDSALQVAIQDALDSDGSAPPVS